MANNANHKPGSIKSKPKSAKARAQAIRNRAARASLYASHNGSSGWQRDVSTWHSTIAALSMGTI